MRPHIFIVGLIDISGGSTPWVRVYPNALALKKAGFDVTIAGEHRAVPGEQMGETETESGGLRCVQVLQSQTGARGWLTQGRIVQDWLIRTLPSVPHAFVIVPHPNWQVLPRIMRTCQKNRVPLVADVMEWTHLKHFLFARARGLLDYLGFDLINRFIVKRCQGVIAISQYLRDYYLAHGCEVLRVPALIDSQQFPWSAESSSEPGGPLRLVFVGSHQRDKQAVILEALRQLLKTGHQVRLDYVGVDKRTFAGSTGLGGLIDECGEMVHFHGRVPYDQVSQIMRNSDFGILLRDRARWSAACFPSKLPEFCALGVPMICNFTSDLDRYLVDGRNSLIVTTCDVPGLMKTIKRALATTSTERRLLRRNARELAEAQFDYRVYSSQLASFIDTVVSKHRQLGAPG